MLNDSQKLITAVSVGLISGGALLYYFAHYTKKKLQLPTSWEEIGKVSEITIYPVKSARAIPVKSANATETGLKYGNLVDRSFILINENGQMVTGRECRRLVTVDTSFADDTLTLTSVEGEKVSVNIHRDVRNDIVKFKIRGDEVQGYDCGDAAAQFLSKVLYDDKKKPRLMYTGLEEFSRAKTHFDFEFPLFKNDDSTLYNDCCSYMFMTEESMKDLNSRLEKPVHFGFFRPCLVIAGSKAFDEDNWDFIKIGETAVFHVAKPCERCILTTIDPKTGDYAREHMEELLKYRQIQFPESLAKQFKKKPIFGVHVGLDVPGPVSVGDKIFVSRPKSPYYSV